MKSMTCSNKWAPTIVLAGALIILASTAPGRAQDSGGAKSGDNANGVENGQKVVSAVVRRGGVNSQVDSFFKELKEQGGVSMHVGLNKRAPEAGGDYFVAVGIAEISAHRSSKNWVISRAAAFDKALNQAKDSVLMSVALEVETETKQAAEEDTSGIETPQQGKDQSSSPNETQLSLFQKIKKLASNKLDEMLAKQEGRTAVTPQTHADKPTKDQVEKIMRQEEFKNFVRISSKAMVSGMQAFQTFEDLESGRNGEIAVIGIVSDKTMSLAASVGSGAPLPKGKPGKPIVDQVPTDDTQDGALQLLNTYGVKTLYDENGDLVLVSFNQASPVNDSTGAELSAQRRAGTFAIGEIRKFLGEQISRVEDVYRSENLKDYEDNTRETEAREGDRYAYDAIADKISITGITPVRVWVAKHPVTGQIVVGSVEMWSPSGKAFSAALRGKMAKAAAEAATPNSPAASSSQETNSNRKKINSDQEGNYQGQGKSGDKNGF
jgi:hypothetical protein